MIFCDVTIPDYNTRTCGIDYAGIVGIGIIDRDENPTLSDLETPEFWASRTSEPNLKYWVIRNTRGEFQSSEPEHEEDIVGYQLTGARHSAVIESPDIKETRDFWEKIMRNHWKLCLVNSGGGMFYVDRPVSFYPKINTPKSIKTAAFFQVELKWFSISNPYILDAPEGVFFGDYIPVDGAGIFDYTFDYTFE